MAKKYFWLKLKNDFFKRHDIMIIENMPNGKDYVLFYLKLLVESLSHDGSLRFSDTIPYSDQMLATITNTNIDTVKAAVTLFIELNLMEMLDDGTIFMNEVQNMVGCETEWAKKKREYRLKVKEQEALEYKPRTIEDNVRQEIEKELEIEKEKDKNNIVQKQVLHEPIIEIFNYYKSLDLINHRSFTDSMKRSIKKALKTYSAEELKELIKRHSEVVEKTKNNEFKVKKRGLDVFFSQKINNNAGAPILYEEYLEGGAKYETYIANDYTEKKEDGRLSHSEIDEIIKANQK